MWGCLLLESLEQLWGPDPDSLKKFLFYILSKHTNLNSSDLNFVHTL